MFENEAPRLYERGYNPIPIVSGEKRPPIKNWQRFSQTRITDNEILELIYEFPKYGVGIVLGPCSRVMGIDFDVGSSHALYEPIKTIINQALPQSPFCKIGSKGSTWFYKLNDESKLMRSFSICTEGMHIIDILYSGRQSVLPPSLHPSGVNYVWENPDFSLDKFDSSELPLINTEDITNLQALINEHLKKNYKKLPGNRNNKLKSMAVAALIKGKDSETITNELLQYDHLTHAPPFFQILVKIQTKVLIL